MEVGGETRVGELRGSVVVVHKVDPARGRVADLPAGRQRAQLLAVDVAQVPGQDETPWKPLTLTHDAPRARSHKTSLMLDVEAY